MPRYDEARMAYAAVVALVRSYASEVVRRDTDDHKGWELVGPERIDTVLEHWGVPQAVRAESHEIPDVSVVATLLDELKDLVWDAVAEEVSKA